MRRVHPAIWASFFVAIAIAIPRASAHPFHEAGRSLGSGLVHPFTGLDHMLAMLAVGFWAMLRGKALAWQLPAAFVAAMVAGGISGMSGHPIFGVEHGIALSVLMLGTAVAAQVRLSQWASLLMVALAGFLHGHAHGAELPAGMGAASYATGFLLATMLLHGTGLLLGRTMQKSHLGIAVRIAGGGIAACGAWMFLAI